MLNTSILLNLLLRIDVAFERVGCEGVLWLIAVMRDALLLISRDTAKFTAGLPQC